MNKANMWKIPNKKENMKKTNRKILNQKEYEKNKYEENSEPKKKKKNEKKKQQIFSLRILYLFKCPLKLSKKCLLLFGNNSVKV